MDEYHLVEFEKFCCRCVHEDDDPDLEGSICDECMSNPVRLNSRRPEKFEERTNG